MGKIKSITIVSAQGVNTYSETHGWSVKESWYRVCGDPYPSYHAIHESGAVVEIRCVHNLEIEYHAGVDLVDLKEVG